MSDIRKKLMEEIEAKAKKRKASQGAGVFSKTVEGIVFDFFKNFDDLSTMGLDGGFDYLYRQSFDSMQGRLRAIDGYCSVNVGYVVQDEDSEIVADTRPQSVTIVWSATHQKKNGGVETTTVGIGDMLFF